MSKPQYQLPLQDAFNVLQDKQEWTDKAIGDLQRLVHTLRITMHDVCKRLKQIEAQK